MAEWKNRIEEMMAAVDPDLLAVAMGVGSVFSSLDPEAAKKFIHPDFVDHEASEGVGGGPEGYLTTARYMNAAFSDASWMPIQIFASGNKYSMILRFSGTHSGDFMGFAGTGKRVDIQHLHVFRVQDGRLQPTLTGDRQRTMWEYLPVPAP